MRYDIGGLTEGYAALYLSIVKAVSPDMAFDMLYEPRQRRKWTDDEIKEIQEYREEGYTWKTLGAIFDTSPGNLHRMVKYYSTRKEKKK